MSLIKPVDEAKEGHAAAEFQERLMDIDTALVAHAQSLLTVEPSQRALDDPAVTPEFLAGLNAAAGDPRLDPLRLRKSRR